MTTERIPSRLVPRETPDPWIRAVAFAIAEVHRLRRERAEQRAKMTVVDGGKRGGEAA